MVKAEPSTLLVADYLHTRDIISGGLPFSYDLCVQYSSAASPRALEPTRGNEAYLAEVEGRYRQKLEQSQDVEALAQAFRQAVA